MEFSVLIVDDEPMIGEGLAYLVKQYGKNCRVAGIAYDGREGYEKAMELKPDIVLADVRMPEEDGLSMIRRLKEAGFAGRFIVLSGYAEFEYARQAVHLGVEEYITKPVDEKELAVALERLCKTMEAQKQQRQHVEGMRQKLDDYSRSIREYALLALFADGDSDGKRIRQLLDESGFPADRQIYGCGVFEGEEIEEKQKRERGFCDVTEACARRLWKPEGVLTILPYGAWGAILCAGFDKVVSTGTWLDTLGKIRADVEKQWGNTVNAGAGTLYGKAVFLRKSYEEACCALNYKVLKKQGCVIGYEQIRDLSARTDLMEEKDLKELEKCVDTMDNEGCRTVVNRIFRKLEERKEISLSDLQLLSLNLVLTGIRKMPFMQVQINEYLGRNILSLESISKFKTMEQLKNWIINMLKSMNELMLKANMPDKRDVVEEAKIYIHKNFNRELSLNEISNQFYINPYYFSQLFKKKTGETYQNYLMNLRVERAKKLLEETDLKLYEVCEMVGYSDTNHFNKIFERITGMKPAEYKRKKEL